MRTFVLGDIHGNFKALLQCFKRSSFDYDQDHLIVVGDVCDGWPQVKESIDELLKIKHLVYILGNHDVMALDWALNGQKDQDWLTQGGENTVRSYNGTMPQDHIDFLKNAKFYFEHGQKLFVHAGIDADQPIQAQDEETLLWDRTLIRKARETNQRNPEFIFSTYRKFSSGTRRH